MQSYKDVIVIKPWGYEYVFYENEFVAVWCLHINKGEATSLHCHPNKKTGLILLDGEAELSFLNDTYHMKPLSRHVIRPGLFHSTKAVTDCILLELETPPKKEDIVRFDDKYGRKLKPIEGRNKMRPMRQKYPMLKSGCWIGNCYLSITRPRYINMSLVIGVLSGGLIAGKDLIVGPGDVGSAESFMRLTKSFKICKRTELLTICAPQF